jgi:hypothetical protein
MNRRSFLRGAAALPVATAVQLIAPAIVMSVDFGAVSKNAVSLFAYDNVTWKLIAMRNNMEAAVRDEFDISDVMRAA